MRMRADGSESPPRGLVAAGLLAVAMAATCGSADAEGGGTSAIEVMVEHDLRGRGVVDERVLGAMRRVPRDRFVPESLVDRAYEDRPLPIGHGQTISQPFVVAYMSAALELEGRERVLEVGTGSGYQAAVLAELAREVYSIEIVEALAQRARLLLDELGYRQVRLRQGDGYRGWPEAAPFDAILVTAAPGHVPQPLVDQLAPGGRMVLPVGPQDDRGQVLLRLRRSVTGSVSQEWLRAVRFVPMTGEAQAPPAGP